MLCDVWCVLSAVWCVMCGVMCAEWCDGYAIVRCSKCYEGEVY